MLWNKVRNVITFLYLFTSHWVSIWIFWWNHNTRKDTYVIKLGCYYGRVHLMTRISEAGEKYYISHFCFDFPHDVCKNVRNVITFSNSFKSLLARVWPFYWTTELIAQVKLFSWLGIYRLSRRMHCISRFAPGSGHMWDATFCNGRSGGFSPGTPVFAHLWVTIGSK